MIVGVGFGVGVGMIGFGMGRYDVCYWRNFV